MSDINKPQLETVIDDTDDLRPADDPIMTEEQAHLDEIYAKLTAMRDDLAAELEHGHEGAAADLRELSDEIRPDFGGAADEVMETLAAIETLNAVIDAYNQYHDFSVDKLRRLLLLLRQPYFAKVRLKMSPDRPARDVYIGAAGMTDERSRPLIVDWRNPVAETYYNQENGQTSYTVNGRTRTVELELRRQFDITRDHLNMYFDTTVAIEDSLLLGALRRHHSEKLKDITATIQREQNEVVRHADVPVLLVNGIAGSGKTSVMLQRIAHPLYGERETLSASQVHLFGPNAVFEHYIDNVLPSMGESNPQVYTWRDFCEAQGAGGRDLGEDTDPACLEKLESDISSLFLTADDLREIRCDGTVLLKAASVESAVAKFARFGVGPRFLRAGHRRAARPREPPHRLDGTRRGAAGGDAEPRRRRPGSLLWRDGEPRERAGDRGPHPPLARAGLRRRPRRGRPPGLAQARPRGHAHARQAQRERQRVALSAPPRDGPRRHRRPLRHDRRGTGLHGGPAHGA